MENIFTKNDLKTGMIVELKNNKRYLVFNDILIGDNMYLSLSIYNKDLSYSGFQKDNDLDIYYVFDINRYDWANGFVKSLNLYNGPILYSRNNKLPKIEITLDDIAKKFKIDKSQIKII